MTVSGIDARVETAPDFVPLKCRDKSTIPSSTSGHASMRNGREIRFQNLCVM